MLSAVQPAGDRDCGSLCVVCIQCFICLWNSVRRQPMLPPAYHSNHFFFLQRSLFFHLPAGSSRDISAVKSQAFTGALSSGRDASVLMNGVLETASCRGCSWRHRNTDLMSRYVALPVTITSSFLYAKCLMPDCKRSFLKSISLEWRSVQIYCHLVSSDVFWWKLCLSQSPVMGPIVLFQNCFSSSPW